MWLSLQNRSLLFIFFFGFSLSSQACTYFPKTGKSARVVAFDVDSTLLYTFHAFNRADQMGMSSKTRDYWEFVNGKQWVDSATIKLAALRLVRKHQSLKQRVIVVTGRHGYNSGPLRARLMRDFGIANENIFFEPHGKSERLRQEGASIMYGDADNDITDAQTAGVAGVRILRKGDIHGPGGYNPGWFGEQIICDSE